MLYDWLTRLCTAQVALLMWLCLMTSMNAVARSLTDIKSTNTLVVALHPGNPPFSYIDHEAAHGIDADLARYFAKQLGVTVRFIPHEDAYTLNAAADITMNMVIDARPSQAAPTLPPPETAYIPYYLDRLALLLDEGRSATTQQEPVKLGVVRPSVADHLLSASDEPKWSKEFQIVHFKTFAALMEAFRSEQIDAVLAPIGQATVARRGAGRKVTIMDPKDRRLPSEKQNRFIGIGGQFAEISRRMREIVEKMARKDALIDQMFSQQGLPYIPPDLPEK